MSSHRNAGGRRDRRASRPSVRPLEGRTLLSASPRVDAFAVPTFDAGPGQIVDGPDGALWFADSAYGRPGQVGRVDGSGLIVEFPLPTPAGGSIPSVAGIADGPDGAIWATDSANARVDRVAADGQITSFAIPGGSSPGPQLGPIVEGPDGNLWFGLGNPFYGSPTGRPGLIGRITPGGVVAEFSLPIGGGSAGELAAGADGVWFTDPSAHRVGKVDELGHVVEFGEATPIYGGSTLAVGPDGDAYYLASDASGAAIVRVSPDGTKATPFLVPGSASNLMAGPDGVVFLDRDGGPIGGLDATARLDRLAPDGTVSTVAESPDPLLYRASNLAFGPDGNLWFTDPAGSIVGRVVLSPSPVPPPGPTLVASAAEGGLAAPIGEPATLDLADFRRSADVTVSSASIDWGDGSSPSPGAIGPVAGSGIMLFPMDAGPFVEGDVTGSHAYARGGHYTATVTILGTGPDGAPSSTREVETIDAVDPSPVAQPSAPLLAGLAIPFAGKVAGFKVPTPHDPSGSDFTASIDWGDGSGPTAGTVNAYSNFVTPFAAASPPDEFDVQGGHTYATSGIFTVAVTLADHFGHASTETTTVRVVPGGLAIVPASPIAAVVDPTPQVVGSYEGLLDLGNLVSLRSGGTNEAVMVDWGDGSAPTAAMIEPGIAIDPYFPGAYEPAIRGFHVYARAGTYTITLTATDGEGDSAEATIPATATPGKAQVEALPLSQATVGEPTPSTPLASIVAPLAGDSAADYAASIDWGDGSSPTPATITKNDGGPFATPDNRFDVAGEHTYAAPGTYPVTITLVGPDGTTTTLVSPFSAGFASVETASSTPIRDSSPGMASVPVVVATFSSPSLDANGEFSATVDWGDGTPPAPATIVRTPQALGFQAQFQVLAPHTYAADGTYDVTVTLLGADGLPVVVANQALVGVGPGPVFNPPGFLPGGPIDPVAIPIFLPIDVAAPPSSSPIAEPLPTPEPPAGPAPIAASTPPPLVEPFDPIVLPIDLPSFAPAVAKHARPAAHSRARPPHIPRSSSPGTTTPRPSRRPTTPPRNRCTPPSPGRTPPAPPGPPGIIAEARRWARRDRPRPANFAQLTNLIPPMVCW